VGIVPVSAAVVAAAFPAFARAYWERLWASAAYFFDYTAPILSGRVNSWQTVIDFLIQNPTYALLGIGYKTLPYTNVLGEPVIVDNMYLSMLAETGVAGLTIMLLLNAALLRAAWRASRDSDGTARFYGAWFFSFWTGELFQMLSGDLLTYWRVLPVYLWVLAIAVRRTDEHTDHRPVQ
jgi:O-antigen ligase